MVRQLRRPVFFHGDAFFGLKKLALALDILMIGDQPRDFAKVVFVIITVAEILADQILGAHVDGDMVNDNR